MGSSVADIFSEESSRAGAIPQIDIPAPVEKAPRQKNPLSGIMKLHHKWTNSKVGRLIAPGLGVGSDMIMKKMLKDKYSQVLGDSRNEHANFMDLAGEATGVVAPGTQFINADALKRTGMGNKPYSKYAPPPPPPPAGMSPTLTSRYFRLLGG